MICLELYFLKLGDCQLKICVGRAGRDKITLRVVNLRSRAGAARKQLVL